VILSNLSIFRVRQIIFSGLFALTSAAFCQYAPEGIQLSEMTPPAANETPQAALAQIQANVDKIKTLKANLVLDQKMRKEDKIKAAKKKAAHANVEKTTPPKWPKEPEGRRVKGGPVELTRGSGAHLVVSRKGSTDEYVINHQVIWSYDHGDKEAQYIPANLPMLSTFTDAAFKLNIFVAVDMETVKLRGTQSINGEECWVIDGKSPEKLSTAGVDPTKLRFWISKKDGVPRLIKIPEEREAYVVMKDIVLNAPTDPAQYNWQPPAGVDKKNMFGF